jgi:PQQ-dependent dehydrogenase (methanol/ethanol family)
MEGRTVLFVLCLLTMGLVVTAQAQLGPSQAELNAAASNAADWLHANHDYGGQRFVEATAINRDNARSLQPTCVYRLGDRNPFHGNPLVYRGVMYVTSAYATIAVDAVSCRVRWRHDWRMKAREIAPHNGGVAVKDGRIVRGTRDGYLLALDAETGRLLWERAVADATKREAFTVPPVIFDNLIIIGPVGNEVPIKGWIGAFSVETGEPVWRFNTVPGPGEPSVETWGPADTATLGGGSVWTPLSVDPTRALVFVPVGNAVPPLNADARPGTNLYTNSLVVLDARTGKLMWHYQPRPSDTHDWDLTQVSPLFSAAVKGERRQLVSVAGKDGLLHVIDTDSREHLYDVAVTRRENTETPLTEEGVHVCPGMFGGVQRNGPAFSPRTNMLYVASVEWCGMYKKSRASVHVMGRPYMGGTWQPDPPKEARGWLTAIDASTGSVRWRYESRRPILAGVTVTSADLVFTGDLDGDFLVLDARDGTVLYRHNIGGRMNGGVVTYQIGGKQYVAVTSGTASIFWRTAPAPATVTIFAIAESGSPPK